MPAQTECKSASEELEGGEGEDETERMLRSVGRENDDKIAAMTPQEIQQEKDELIERFGGGLLDVLRKRREKREQSQGEFRSKKKEGGERIVELRSFLPSRRSALMASLSYLGFSIPSGSSSSTSQGPSEDTATPVTADDTNRIIQSIQKENDERILAMSHEERMSEKQELLDKFGGGLLDVLRKRREAREGKESVGGSEKREDAVVVVEQRELGRSFPFPHSILNSSPAC